MAKYYAIDITDKFPTLLGPFANNEHQKSAVRLAATQNRNVIYLDLNVDREGTPSVGRVTRVDGSKDVG